MSVGRARRFAVLVQALATAGEEIEALANRPDVNLVDKARLARMGTNVAQVRRDMRRIKDRYDAGGDDAWRGGDGAPGGTEGDH